MRWEMYYYKYKTDSTTYRLIKKFLTMSVVNFFILCSIFTHKKIKWNKLIS